MEEVGYMVDSSCDNTLILTINDITVDKQVLNKFIKMFTWVIETLLWLQMCNRGWIFGAVIYFNRLYFFGLTQETETNFGGSG
jgi:hypothetical protein